MADDLYIPIFSTIRKLESGVTFHVEFTTTPYGYRLRIRTSDLAEDVATVQHAFTLDQVHQLAPIIGLDTFSFQIVEHIFGELYTYTHHDFRQVKTQQKDLVDFMDYIAKEIENSIGGKVPSEDKIKVKKPLNYKTDEENSFLFDSHYGSGIQCQRTER